MQKKHIFIDSDSKLSKDEVTIAIRSLTISDINEKYCSWMNDKDVNRYLESRLIFWDIKKLRAYYREKEKNDIFLAIIDKSTNEHIGNIKISSIDMNNKRAELGLMIGNKKYWGKGVASEAIKLTTNYCFSELNLHKVIAGAYANNKASIQAFLKNGFSIEGERYEHFWSDNTWTSAILLGKINKIHT